MTETLGFDPRIKTLICPPFPWNSMDFYRRRRNSILLLVAVGFSGYGVYKAYHLPSVVKKRSKLARLLQTLASIAEAVTSSAETISLVSSDLNRFLRSDSDEIPTSLKQISKIARSDEFVGSLSRVSEALTVGICRGIGSKSGELEFSTKPSFSDRILDKLLSPSGSGFVSIVAGSFARNLVVGFYSSESNGGEENRLRRGSDSPVWMQLISDEKLRELIADSIRVFVSTAVTVYLEKTMAINTYDEFFAGLTDPKHETKAKDILVSVCNGAVETLVKTSHRVITGSNSRVENLEQEAEIPLENVRRNSFNLKEKTSSGWLRQVSSTLAVPSNRTFVLDVTGRVTFETVRSFLDFLLWKSYEGARRSVQTVREGVVDRGLEVVRYFSAKSMLVVTMCIALCLRLFSQTSVLMPA